MGFDGQSRTPFAKATERFTSILHLETNPGGPRVVLTGQYLGPAGDIPGLLRSLRGVPGASLSYGQQSYFAMQMRWAGCSHMSFNACHNVGQWPGGQVQRDTFRAGSDYVNRPLSGAGRATAIRHGREGLPLRGGKA